MQLKRKPLLKNLKGEERQKHSRDKRKLMLLIKPEEMKPRELLNLPNKTDSLNKKPRMRDNKLKQNNSKLRTKPRMLRLPLQSEQLREEQESLKLKCKRLRSRSNSSLMPTEN